MFARIGMLRALNGDGKAGEQAHPPQVRAKLQLQLYFSDEFTEVKLPLRVVPMLLTAAMITKAIPVAIRQYSMAVAPD